MYTESRRIHLLEEVLKVTNEATLVELEIVLKKSRKKVATEEKRPSIYDFLGILTKKEAKEMRIAIEETCGTVNSEDWK